MQYLPVNAAYVSGVQCFLSLPNFPLSFSFSGPSMLMHVVSRRHFRVARSPVMADRWTGLKPFSFLILFISAAGTI